MGFLGEILGKVKDKASLGKATILSHNHTQLIILKATTHANSTPPPDHHLSAILSAGEGPRSSASAMITSLMTRLHKTSSAPVALKCLLSLHVIIQRGTFILHDQLSIYPSSGGRNYLNLSSFRDNSSPATWQMSKWIRWHAKYIEQMLSTSRILGYFLFSLSSTLDRDKAREMVASLLFKEILREIDGLVNVIEEIIKIPDFLCLEGNGLIMKVMDLVSEDFFTAVDEIMIRVEEFKERISCMSFVESVELACALKRLEGCKDRVESMFEMTGSGSGLVEELWGVVAEMREKVDQVNRFKEEKMVVSWGRFESARFSEPVVKKHEPVRFSSNRFVFQYAHGEHVS